jgi:hypothetical protein
MKSYGSRMELMTSEISIAVRTGGAERDDGANPMISTRKLGSGEGLHSAPRLYSINGTMGEIDDQHNNHCR